MCFQSDMMCLGSLVAIPPQDTVAHPGKGNQAERRSVGILAIRHKSRVM